MRQNLMIFPLIGSGRSDVANADFSRATVFFEHRKTLRPIASHRRQIQPQQQGCRRDKITLPAGLTGLNCRVPSDRI
jgi:hypothetical protein